MALNVDFSQNFPVIGRNPKEVKNFSDSRAMWVWSSLNKFMSLVKFGRVASGYGRIMLSSSVHSWPIRFPGYDWCKTLITKQEFYKSQVRDNKFILFRHTLRIFQNPNTRKKFTRFCNNTRSSQGPTCKMCWNRVLGSRLVATGAVIGVVLENLPSNIGM